MLTGWFGVQREREVTELARDAEQFVTQLRQTYPSIPSGSRLYVVEAPTFYKFFPSYLSPTVALYYADVETVAAFDGNIPEQLQSGDVVFRYSHEEAGR